jgi:hypothetical protein
MANVGLNEQAVREEIIAPILRALGYRAGGEHDIRHGKHLSLRYPRSHLGHKKRSDPKLEGYADYICYAKGRISWTVEAKGAEESLTIDVVEQAYTYAKHPEVRSVYFAVCNGKEFRLYLTDAAPTQPALLTIVDLTNFDATVEALAKFVAPSALLKRFADGAGPAFPALGKTLSSYAQITGGWIVHERPEPPIPGLVGFTVTVEGEAIERTDAGLLAIVRGRAPYESLQRLIERLGLTPVNLQSTSMELSVVPTNPTVFEAHSVAVFPKGELMPNITTGTEVRLEFGILVELRLIARVTLTGHIVTGPFEMNARYVRADDPTVLLLTFRSVGSCSLRLN